MVASDVYTIAKALPIEEMAKLYDMLKKDIEKRPKIKKGRKKLPDFTVEDALDYLLEHHIK
ncbi:hypothetical protein [Maribacter thermophilus]|uniref:hypothetical protein n=1 Tax=Maribacter thermophilus TaxID=1197874 RepID=UPI000640D8C6|nr:hypothetical protein [Maribacter thermophilus]